MWLESTEEMINYYIITDTIINTQQENRKHLLKVATSGHPHSTLIRIIATELDLSPNSATNRALPAFQL
jgi:hypothetical protein